MGPACGKLDAILKTGKTWSHIAQPIEANQTQVRATWRKEAKWKNAHEYWIRLFLCDQHADYIVLTVQVAYILFQANSNIYFFFNKFFDSRFYDIKVDIDMDVDVLKCSHSYVMQ